MTGRPFSLVFIVFSRERMSRIASQELQVKNCKSNIASQELQVKNCKSRIASQELQVKNCKSRIASQELQVCKSRIASQELQVKNCKSRIARQFGQFESLPINLPMRHKFSKDETVLGKEIMPTTWIW
jgi:phage-related tail protein